MNIGVLGAGQLGRMLALAGYPLGLNCVFLDPNPHSPAGEVARQLVAPYSDAAALDELASLDLVTYEFESIPQNAASSLNQRVPVWPPPEALRVAQDRLAEKTCFQELGIPTAEFAAVDDARTLTTLAQSFSGPGILKTRRLGYDGKGQFRLQQPSDSEQAWNSVGQAPSIYEKLVDFERELSIIAVRGRDGETRFYPLVENHHRAGILRLSLAPAPNLDPRLQTLAEEYAGRLLERLGYVGVMALELFVVGDRLLANEIAPRVHNSGHWTIEGAETSQFENHLRAITGLPLGSTNSVGHSAMLNIVGAYPEKRALLALPDAHFHDYGKSPRPGRKLGHVTLRANSAALLMERLTKLEAIVPASDAPHR